MNSILECILNNIPVYLFVKDPGNEFRYLYWNRAFEEYSRIPASRALGHTDYEIFPSPKDAEHFRQDDLTLLRTGEGQTFIEEYVVSLMHILEAAIRAEAGESTLNINSARQLGEVLFATMRIADKPKMTNTKQFCTDEDYLQTFARKHRIVDLILEYRGVKKLLSTYVEALPQLVNRTTGRIHTSFNPVSYTHLSASSACTSIPSTP